MGGLTTTSGGSRALILNGPAHVTFLVAPARVATRVLRVLLSRFSRAFRVLLSCFSCVLRVFLVIFFRVMASYYIIFKLL